MGHNSKHKANLNQFYAKRKFLLLLLAYSLAEGLNKCLTVKEQYEAMRKFYYQRRLCPEHL